MATAQRKLRFAYLYYTTNTYGTVLVGVFAAKSAAKTHLDMVHGEYVPVGTSNRVLQKVNHATGQVWYVERHVMKDPL